MSLHQVNVEQDTWRAGQILTVIRQHFFQEGKIDVGGHVAFPRPIKHVDDFVCLERLAVDGSASVNQPPLNKTHAQRVSHCFFGTIVDDEGTSGIGGGGGRCWGEQCGDLSGEFDGCTRDFDACADGERCKARRGVSEEC